MKVSLSPPSGYSHSYYDILFKVDFEPSDEVEICITNNEAKQDIEILSISDGHILNATIAKAKKVSSISGYINIFNRDKLNKQLERFVSVDLKFKATRRTGGEIIEEEEVVSFFNQDKSLDAKIVPFDVIVEQNDIDIDHNIPLVLHIVSDTVKKYEICVRSTDGEANCPFSVLAKKGTTKVSIPIEYIYSRLNLKFYRNRKYKLYWAKLQGLTLGSFVNRSYIPIPDTDLTFSGQNIIKPSPQTRTGPDGNALPFEDFVLSDRYLVPVWREYSSFGTKDKRSISSFAKLYHEGIELEKRSNLSVGAFSNKGTPVSDTEASLATALRRRSNRPFIHKPKDDSLYLRVYKDNYKKMVSMAGYDKEHNISEDKVVNMSASSKSTNGVKKPRGCGCTRKKNV